MTNTPVIESLNSVLANSYALYLKTQNYHWNVTGENFKSLHELFEVQYTDMAAAIDEIAERIRTLGAKAPGSWKDYTKYLEIEDGDYNKTAKEMVIELANDQDKIIAVLNESLSKSSNADDEVTSDMMIGRISIHEKARWMLRSSI